MTTSTRAAWLLLTLACGDPTPTRAPANPANATAVRPAEADVSAPRAADPPVDAPPVVVFAVLDTFRADHTSLCGYERPTTPTLQEIVNRGAVHTCRAYSPAPWTHPSHASYFTGRSVVEHHAVWVTDSSVSINPVTRVRPLDDGFVTLAERFEAAGYQTLAVSANMIITPPTGLLQGFSHIATAEESYALRGDKFFRRVEAELAKLDKTRPLFLFLNLYDAHDPYPPIPKGVRWVPHQPIENLYPNQHDPNHDYVKFIKGTGSKVEDARLLRRIRNGYDWGMHQADAGLGASLQHLIDQGWTEKGWRVVITSDHGEFLGEHRLLRHGGFVHEPVVNVPLLAYDSTRPMPALPEPAAAIWAYDLLLAGALPATSPPVHAVSEPNERDVLIGTLSGALWGGDDKLLCTDHQPGRYDLATDPRELRRLPVAGHPMEGSLRALCDDVNTLHHLPPPDGDDEGLIKALQAVGYME